MIWNDADSRPVALRDASEVLRAIAHPIRLQLLAALTETDRGVSELVGGAQLPQPVISRHLAILRRAGLVRCAPSGRERVYALADPRARTLLDVLFAC